MSRSGYVDCLDSGELNCWRGAVESAIRGKRGQAFLRELLAALDAMPKKRLITRDLVTEEGECCAIGSVAIARGQDVSELDTHEPSDVADAFGIARALAAEIEFLNDDDFGHEVWCWTGPKYQETPEHRWKRMRDWVARQIIVQPDEVLDDE